ncbi:MAG: helicase C-terminal domain-containing protein [Asticcacaulis sp.]
MRQRTLVLTCSHKDTAELARRLRARKIAVIDYKPGDRLDDVLAAFAADGDAILIGANLWERVDLPGLVKHLVVTRLPIGSRAPGAAPARLDGVKAQDTQRNALAALMQEARRKLRLGIGRAIRNAHDDAHIWITDPRFPLPGSLSDNPRLQLLPGDPVHKAFSVCIPERFRAGLFATYPSAALIDPEARRAAAESAGPATRRARH